MPILLLIGKGGVGKTTLSALSALQLAERGQRVALVSLDPAHNLSDVLGKRGRSIPSRLRRCIRLEEPDIDRAAATFLKELRQEMGREYRHLSALNIDHLLDAVSASPGITEYALSRVLGTVLEQAGREDWLVIDTPPTALTLRMLALPAFSARWLDELLRIRKAILRRRLSLRNFLGDADFGARIEARCGFQEGDDRVFQRLQANRARETALAECLRAPATHLMVVLNPDHLSLQEADRIHTRLQAENIPLWCGIMNRYQGEQDLLEQAAQRLKLPLFPVAGFPRQTANAVEQFLQLPAPFLEALLQEETS